MTCSILDKANGSLVGDFDYYTACGKPAAWDLCDLVTHIYNEDFYAQFGTLSDPLVGSGVVEGSWSISLNSRLTKLYNLEDMWSAVISLMKATKANTVYEVDND